MQSHVYLLLPHERGHHSQPPVVEITRAAEDEPLSGMGPAEVRAEQEAVVWFREADDERLVLRGCPQCLVNKLRATADRIEAALGGR